MTPLEYDPRTKSQIKDAIFDYIYTPVIRHFKARIDTIIARNTILGGYYHNHFVYKGVLYNSDSSNPPLKKNRLHPQLRVLMEEYLADEKQLNQRELPMVVGFLSQVLNTSTSLADYMRVFPESVHHPLTTLAATCPCRATQLGEEKVEHLKLTNRESIQMIKQRLVSNLLI